MNTFDKSKKIQNQIQSNTEEPSTYPQMRDGMVELSPPQ